MKRKLQVPVAKDILSRVPLQVSFWLCTNENLRGLADVSEALQRATDDVFRYHVNRDKNDFEVWIRDVVRDKDLAREIARVKTRGTLIRKISERVEELSSVVKKGAKARAKRKSKPRRRQKSVRRAKRQLQRRVKSRTRSHARPARHRRKR